MLKETSEKAEAADNNYNEVAKKLATCESDLKSELMWGRPRSLSWRRS